MDTIHCSTGPACHGARPALCPESNDHYTHCPAARFTTTRMRIMALVCNCDTLDSDTPSTLAISLTVSSSSVSYTHLTLPTIYSV